MKAEQRKELETNTLADKMGVAMQKAKAASRRAVLLYAGLGLACLVVVFFAYRYFDTQKAEASETWVELHDGQRGLLEKVATKENAAGKAARLQIAWFLYWEQGIKLLGHNQEAGLKALEAAAVEYKEIQKLCADDPIFEPQAMLGQAVAEECLTVKDATYLEKAKRSYEEIQKKYEKSAEARFAKERLDEIKKGNHVADTYVRLQDVIRGPGGFGGGGFPGMNDPHSKLTPEQREMLQKMLQGKQ